MHRLSVSVDGYTFEVELNPVPVNGSGVLVRVSGAGETQDILVATPDPAALIQDMEWFLIDDHPYEVAVDPDMQWIRSRWGIFPLKVEDLDSSMHRPHLSDGRVKAPIPGQITQVLVKLDEQVASGKSRAQMTKGFTDSALDQDLGSLDDIFCDLLPFGVHAQSPFENDVLERIM